MSDLESVRKRKKPTSQPQYACNYCSSKYCDKDRLELHIRTHGTYFSHTYILRMNQSKNQLPQDPMVASGTDANVAPNISKHEMIG